MSPLALLPSTLVSASCPNRPVSVMSLVRRRPLMCTASADSATASTIRQNEGSGSPAPTLVRVSICTARTCRRQGSEQIYKFAQDLHLDGVKVKSVGCLMNCGDGPNVGMDPPVVVLNKIDSPARFREAMQEVAGVIISPETLKATELRLEGNSLARDGDLAAAIERYSVALALDIPSGKHLLFANRAGARLTLGDKEGAVSDADAAAECGPDDFTTAYVRQVEAYAALGQYEAASQALEAAGERHPYFVRSPEGSSLRKQLDKLMKQ